MSAPQHEVLGSLLLRSSTPGSHFILPCFSWACAKLSISAIAAPEEKGTWTSSLVLDAELSSSRKVLVFLEQLKSESERASTAKSRLEDEFGTNINGGDEQEDMASDVQEGAQSTVGSLVHHNGVVRRLYPTSGSAHRPDHSTTPLHPPLHYFSMNPGRTTNLVPTTSLMDRRGATLAHCLRRALLARSVSFWHGILLCDRQWMLMALL
jgi:hypothetical protein